MIMKKIVCVFLTFILIFEFGQGIVNGAEKKSYKTDIENFLKKMEKFEHSLLYEIDLNEPETGTSKKIKLTKDRMVRAVALTIGYKSDDDVVYTYESGPEFEIKYKIDSGLLKKAGKELFGKTLKTSYLSSDNYGSYAEAYNDKEYGPIVSIRNISGYAERKTYKVYNTKVKKNKDKYTVTKKCYMGYTGGEFLGEYNYSIIYTLKETSDSGYIITGIKVKKTGKTFTEHDFFILATEDVDGDGLPTVVEMELGTDIKNPDTDGDGLDDYIEYVNNLDPLDPTDADKLSKTKDSDFDGLSDYLELFEYKTDPKNFDTDKDYLEDGFEVKHGFDPLNPDTDNDGILDGDELIEQTYHFEISDFGWQYKELLESAGKTVTEFGREIIVPENIGALKSITITTLISGNIDYAFDIYNLFGRHVILTGSSFVIGLPVEIRASKEIGSCKIVFEYDESWLPKGSEKNLGVTEYASNGDPEYISDYKLDTKNNTVSFSIEGSGYYSLTFDPKKISK